MKLPLFQLWQAVRSSYWFVPSLMAVGAMILGAFMVWLDAGPASDLFEDVSWYQKSKPEGARAVLSAIAGSMITVAGVVFSITIVAISFAANQYGPRILTNFMSDRGNQVTLGTFIATFLYSVVVLRTIYSGDTEFVPQLAVMVAMLLALCSIAVLIYFIHHVPESIHVNHVIGRIGRQLHKSIDKHFPACFGEPPKQDGNERKGLEEMAADLFGEGVRPAEVGSRSAGYIQAMDEDQLLSTACKYDLVLRLLRTPGEFVYEGMPFALAAPADRVTDEARDALRATFSVGSRRTPFQDLLFLIDELVDVAARALSTGVNDPFTAMSCVDWLTAGAAEMARRQPPSPFRLDDKGELRVVAPSGSFAEQLDRGFGNARPYLAGDVNSAVHTARMLGTLAEQCRSDEQIAYVREQLDALVDLAGSKLEPELLKRLEEVARSTRQALYAAAERCSGAGQASRRAAAPTASAAAT